MINGLRKFCSDFPSASFYYINNHTADILNSFGYHITCIGHESNIKLIIDDRESAITNQRLLKVPPKLKGIGLEFDIMTTHNKIHKDLFVKAGFPQSKICVNGAPQSDYWFKKTYWQKLSKLNSDLREDRIKILFFSFGERTYMNFYYGDEQRTWMPFIKEVNDVLIAILEKYHDKIQIIYIIC